MEKIRKVLSWLKGVVTKPISILWAVLIALAIGLAPIWYENTFNEPELVGRILAISTAAGGIISDNLEMEKNLKDKLIYTVYLTIANKREVPVSVLDYELKLHYKDGTIRECFPIYSKVKQVRLGFEGFDIVFDSEKASLLYKIQRQVTKDSSLSGIINFEFEGKQKMDFSYAEVLLIDSFGGSHWIRTPFEEYRPLSVLPFIIEGMKIEKHTSME